MTTKPGTIFERNKKKTIIILISVVILIAFSLIELSLEKFMGLGNPIIYDSNPLYGYRPVPNKEYTRFYGANLKFNNLGLRAPADWDQNPRNKILFLGDSVTYGGSYIDNKELFSYLAVKEFNNYQSGNAAVNAWGVENIYGLIVESKFMPAKIYLTILTEGDFYRGLTRIAGLPFYNVKPKFALLELWYYFCYKQNLQRYKNWLAFAAEPEKTLVVEKAVNKLKEMDIFLAQQGCQHLVFISPSKAQVLNAANKDMVVYKLLHKYDLKPIYIIDKFQNYNLPAKTKADLFYDNIHLNKKGHEIWARIIKSELLKLLQR